MRYIMVAVLLAGTVAAQAPQRFAVSGRVVDDIYRRGVPLVRVTLSGGGLARPIPADSTEQGTFEFGGLVAGSYNLNFEKAGFFSDSYGEPINVGSAARADVGEIELVVRRRITGKARWANGDPLSSKLAGVQAHLVMGDVNGSTLKTNGFSGMNDRGEFAVEGLRPGRYILASQIVSQGGSRQMQERILKADPGFGSWVTLPVFYPGGATYNINTNVDLRNVAEMSGAELVFQDKPGVAIEGIVTPSADTPEGTRIGVSLSLPVEVPDLQSFMFADVETVGQTFRFHDIPPGDYLLLTSVGTSRRGVQPLTVGTQPIRDLRIDAPAIAPVVGTVEFEEGDGTRMPASPVNVFASFNRIGLFGRERRIAVDSKGEFKVTDTAPGGTYDLLVKPLMPNAYVTRITQGARTFTDGVPASAIAGGGPVRITLKKDGGSVSGQVTSRDGSATWGFVVLAPKNRRAKHWFRSMTTGRNGQFELTSVAPGEYDLFAFDRNDDDWFLNANYLAGFAGQSTGVIVGSGADVTAQVEVTATPRR